MPNSNLRRLLARFLILGVLSACLLLLLPTRGAKATPGCHNDPTGNLAWCCESHGYILDDTDPYNCVCRDDNWQPVGMCGG